MNLFERHFYGNPLYDWIAAIAASIVLTLFRYFEQECIDLAYPTRTLYLQREIGGVHG